MTCGWNPRGNNGIGCQDHGVENGDGWNEMGRRVRGNMCLNFKIMEGIVESRSRMSGAGKDVCQHNKKTRGSWVRIIQKRAGLWH